MSDENEKPRFVGGKTRTETVPLQYPIEFRGVIYDAITVHRLSVGDIEAHAARYADAVKVDAAAAERLRLPTFGDTPDEVIDFLDVDDRAAVNQAVERFAIPLALRTATESPPASGEPSP